MSVAFVHAFHCEWLKKKRSLAAWLIVVGSVFTPAVVLFANLVHHDDLPQIYASEHFWTQLWTSSWESVAIFFLPMGVILATSLITQLEFRNNAWKQVHTLPLHHANLFFAKLAIIFVMLVQFLLVFNIAIYVSGVAPALLVGGVPYPPASIPYVDFLIEDALYFVDCLPIVTAQYAASLRFSNFLIPVGVGFVAWVAALSALPWQYGFAVPYTYCMYDYLKDHPGKSAIIPDADFHLWAIGYSVLFTIVGYWMFANRNEKG